MRNAIVTIGDLGCAQIQGMSEPRINRFSAMRRMTVPGAGDASAVGMPGMLPGMSNPYDPRDTSALADTLDPAGIWRRLNLQDSYDGQNESVPPLSPYSLILDDAASSSIEGMGDDDPGPPPNEIGPDGTGGGTSPSSVVVGWVQQALTSLASRLGRGDFDPKGVDGQAGPNTAAAVSAFQAWAGIQVDGVIGPQTTGAIVTALQKGATTTVAGVPVWVLALGGAGVLGLAFMFLRKKRRGR